MGFPKGSQQSKVHMEMVRSMRGNKKTSNQSQTQSMDNNNIEQTQVSKRGRLVKGTTEAREYMAMLRSKRK